MTAATSNNLHIINCLQSNIVCMRHRINIPCHGLNVATHCMDYEKWESGVLDLLMTLKNKVWYFLHLPTFQLKNRYPKPFHFVVSEHETHFLADFEAQLLHYVYNVSSTSSFLTLTAFPVRGSTHYSMIH